jgi:hypothetical protein
LDGHLIISPQSVQDYKAFGSFRSRLQNGWIVRWVWTDFRKFKIRIFLYNDSFRTDDIVYGKGIEKKKEEIYRVVEYAIS